MYLSSRSTRRLPIAAAALSLLAALAPASAAAQAPALPAASELLAKHIAASGGEAAIRQHRSTRLTGVFELPAAGLTGELTMLSAAPNRTYVKMVIPGMGEIVSGYDGTHAWSVNPMAGARLADGAELQMQQEMADYYGALGQQPGIASRTTVERTELGGVACWKVKVTWKSGRESHECYAVESGLLAGQQMRAETPQGAADITMLIGDYKEFGGTRVATTMRQQMMGMEQVFRITTLEYDTVTPAELAPPAAIQTLIKARGATPPKP